MRFYYVIVLVLTAEISYPIDLRAQVQKSQKPDIKACIDGPTVLRFVDEVELKGHKITGDVTPEQLAETYIGDCSYWIGNLSLLSMDKGTINLLQTNLDYMTVC